MGVTNKSVDVTYSSGSYLSVRLGLTVEYGDDEDVGELVKQMEECLDYNFQGIWGDGSNEIKG